MPKSRTYDEFVEKFRQKKTTDDCITPPYVYEAVKKWVVDEYGLESAQVLRPFWPGEDYTACDYPAGCVVIDNPPFSILSKIVDFYTAKSVRFFLFAQEKTCLTVRAKKILADVRVRYENGAYVNTAFVTNLEEAELRTAPELTAAINAAVERNRKKTIRPRIEYPPEVVSFSPLARLARAGIAFSIAPSECVHISRLDAQGKKAGIYGGGYLVSETVAKKLAEALEAAPVELVRRKVERAKLKAVQVYALSARERAIVDALDRREGRPDDPIG